MRTKPVADTEAQPSAAHRRPDIQGLRAVAVLLVMAYHAGLPLPGGFAGVDVFFVLSGFVITATLVREVERSGSISLRRFYIRRIRRLLPALAIVVAATALAGWAMLPLESQSHAGTTGAAASASIANFEIMRSTGGYFDANAEENALLHTWSLSVEEQFYVVFPGLLLLAWTRTRGRLGPRGGALTAVALVLAASFTLSVALSQGMALPWLDSSQEFAFYSPFSRAWQFAAGSILALGWPVVVARRAGVPSLARTGPWIGTALVACTVFWIGGSGYPGYGALLPTLGTCVLIATTDAGQGLVGRVLASRPAVFLGDLSYSLYLWHWPVLVLGNALVPDARVRTSVLLVLLSFVPAYLSYRWVEDPIRNAGQWSSRRVVGLAAFSVGVPALLCSLLAWGAGSAWWNPQIAQWEQVRTQRPVSRAAECHTNSVTQLGRPWTKCLFGDGDRGTILVVGDSHAAALGDTVIAAVRPLGFKVAIHTTNGCPFLTEARDWDIWGQTSATETCALGLREEWALVAQYKPSLVILANSSSLYVRESPRYGDPVTAASRWRESVTATLQALREQGVPSLLVYEVPDHPKSLATCTKSWGVDLSCVNTGQDYAASRRAPSHEAESSAVAQVPNATAWDPMPILCDGTTCYREHDGRPIYLDGNHLNPSASSVLARPLQDVLASVLPAGPRT
jgi:peptidoglycan/LPS O-acetylase OafA/YrhL